MYLVTVNPDQPLCFESDSASELDTCHHVLDNFIDGGLDAQILPHKCPPTGGLGCCAYADDGGAWSVCYYYDAYTPTNVEGFCAETDGSYVNR